VGLGGFEPPTSPLSGVRSDQLSYRPGVIEFVCLIPPRQWGHQDNRASLAETKKTGNLCWELAAAEADASSFKGGDPAARSRTATLLRLHPSH
jgi:hypothetical protein